MGLAFENLDEITRRYMIDEIKADIAADRLYRSPRLSQRGQGDWQELILEAAQHGNDDSLAADVRRRGLLNSHERRVVKGRSKLVQVPATAPLTLAEGEFNRFYVRGLCRRTIDEGISRLEVYRAKRVDDPRLTSLQIEGLLMDPNIVLIDLRGSIGVETAFGLPPGPNSGMTLRIGRQTSSVSTLSQEGF